MNRRDHALDALRGYALLGMALSGLVPWGTLPAWMYHAQLPPPDHQLNVELYGVTWVDLVFPFFLFAMGAAIPLALGSRVPKEDDPDAPLKWLLLVGGILVRGFGLMVFAVAVQHFRAADRPGDPWLWTSLVYFGFMVLSMLRLPKGTPPALEIPLRLIGISGVFYGLVTVPVQVGKFDVILMVLANVYVTASLLWLALRRFPQARFLALAAVAGIFLAAGVEGFPKLLFDLNWGWGQGNFQKYLLIVLPAMVLAEPLPEADQRKHNVLAAGFGALQAGLGIVGAVLFVGYREVATGFFLLSVLAINALWTVRHDCEAERAHRWGWGLLLLGLLIEPIGGGMRKDWATLSYLVATPGLAFLSYAILKWADGWLGRTDRVAVSVETWKALGNRVRGIGTDATPLPGFVALVGQNPLLGYIVITNLVYAGVRLTGLHAWQNDQPWSPWQRAVYAFALTILVGAVCALFSRLKVFCRL